MHFTPTTPEEIQKMTEIFNAIQPYQPPVKDSISARYSTYLNRSSILNIK